MRLLLDECVLATHVRLCTALGSDQVPTVPEHRRAMLLRAKHAVQL